MWAEGGRWRAEKRRGRDVDAALATELLLRRRKRSESMGSNDGVSLLWLRPSRVGGVSWNVRDTGWDRILSGCGEEEEDWTCSTIG